MTYKQVIRQLQKIALEQHNVRSTGYGDLYRDLQADPSIKYDVFYITSNQSSSYGDFDRFSLNLFWISRLENMDGDNTLQLHSIGKEILDIVANVFCNRFTAEIYGTTYYNFFTQRFADECAGLWMTITFQVPKSVICEEE